MRRGRASRPLSRTLLDELPYWRRTGVQDWQNVGSPLETAEEAGVRPSDDEGAAQRKILKMLLRDSSIDTWGGSGIDGDWTDAEKRKLLLAWARGWAEAAAGSCLETVREDDRRRREDEEG